MKNPSFLATLLPDVATILFFKYFTSTERTRGGDDLQEGLQRPETRVEEVQPPVLRGHPPVLDMAPVPHQPADEGARQQGAQETQSASLFYVFFSILVFLVVIRHMRLHASRVIKKNSIFCKYTFNQKIEIKN